MCVEQWSLLASGTEDCDEEIQTFWVVCDKHELYNKQWLVFEHKGLCIKWV